MSAAVVQRGQGRIRLLHFQHAGKEPAQLCESAITFNRMPTTVNTGNYTDCPKKGNYDDFRPPYVKLQEDIVQAGVQVALPAACGAGLL